MGEPRGVCVRCACVWQGLLLHALWPAFTKSLTAFCAPLASPASAAARAIPWRLLSCAIFSLLSARARYVPEMKSVKAFFSSRMRAAGALARRAMREP